MDISKINKAAEILYNSRVNLKRIKKLPEDCIPQSYKEAYDIQEELVNRYLTVDKNNLLIGKKIGCTNKAAQIQLNINESFFGNMFSNNISKSNCIINSENYFSPLGNVAVSYYGRNLDRHVSKLIIEEDPDQSFEYISVATQMLGMVLQEATGQTLSDYCEQKLWKPLGMEYPASWSVDRKKGREKSFCCLNARARDYAKFGRLFLKEGNNSFDTPTDEASLLSTDEPKP